MNRENKIKQEIEKTLNCLDQIEPLKADAFFYSRLKARMDSEASKERKFLNLHFGWKVLASALIIIIVAANIYTVSIFLKTKDNAEADRQELIHLFATELTLDSSQYNPTLALNE